MPLKLDCSRCKQTLTVPTQKAGSFVQCPRCQGRVWVPENAGEGFPSNSSQSALTAAPPSGPPPALPPGPAPAVPPGPVHPGLRMPPAPPAAGPFAPPAAASVPPVAMPIPPSPAPRPPLVGGGKKVARFISAESSQSLLKPASDGKLPELKLDDGQSDADVATAQRSSVNPLVLLAALSLSVTFSVLIVFVDFGDNRGKNFEKKAAARFAIEKDYFPDVRESALDKTKKLEPYQVCLSEAQQAYARQDWRTERAMYLKVLSMLRAERGAFQKGFTGSLQRDKQLEEYVTTLLSED